VAAPQAMKFRFSFSKDGEKTYGLARDDDN
jgi:hypothetical protein